MNENEGKLLQWQQHSRLRFVSCLRYITAAKFQQYHFNISHDILNFMINLIISCLSTKVYAIFVLRQLVISLFNRNFNTVPLETMGPFAANLPRSIRGFDLRFHLGKTSSNRNKNLGFT